MAKLHDYYKSSVVAEIDQTIQLLKRHASP